MIVRGIELTIDFLEELAPYNLQKVRLRGSELICCSPFRNENSPSFSLNYESGLWIDYGAVSDLYKKGNFIKLLAFLREESYQETEDFLLEQYHIKIEDTDNLKLELNINLKSDKPKCTTIINKYKSYIKETDYFSNRGISTYIQELFELGYNKEDNSVAMAWYSIEGTLANIKYRTIANKKFYYEKEGTPIKHLVFGIHLIKKYNIKTVAIVEAEIDCLYLWSLGIPAIALGGSNLSEKQQKIIVSSGIAELVVATDNDRVGRQLAQLLTVEFSSHMKVTNIDFITTAKDVNECSSDTVYEMFKHKNIVNYNFIK